ncbi:hyaluronan mediated motility receptor isoform X1 [Brienomyrus brachyistius]|uniref:hyaluronan mediated motility receptor isoform X1 n=1 Tax=Brienomyrus brachyistius TaxID=42636 RepID=UPI0020B2BCA7|nr:hyaluronan mediated motility receptor isoform X1 [Brienomyrus brachyistius]
MRRFLTIQRDEDYAQIQFLTAKCNQLVREKALLEREVLLAVERDRALRTELAAVSLRLCQQEQANVQLCVKHEGLLAQTRQQEKHLLTSRPEESPRDTGLLGQQLEQVCAELEQLQSSDAQLESLVEEIQRESLQRTAQVEELQAELRSKSQELEELRCYHQGAVQELHWENEGSLRKLQETAEQFEWLCEQQRNWMCCVKRFKDCMSEEREALLQQMGQMEAELRVLRKATKTKGLEEDGSEPRAISSRLNTWDADVMTDLQAEVDNWRHLYEDLYGKLTSHSDVWTVDGSQQPP